MKYGIAACLVLLALGSDSSAWSASFDCRAVHLSRPERLICVDPHVSALDSALGAEYGSAWRVATPGERVRLMEEEKEWIAVRNLCPTTACLVQAYRMRIAQLHGRRLTEGKSGLRDRWSEIGIWSAIMAMLGITARRSGYKRGYERGRAQGYDAGYKAGNSEGLAVGRDEGYATGVASVGGSSTSANAARERGYKEGYARGKSEGEREGYERGKADSERADLDLHRVRRLIQLCHPDKHGGSKAATEISQWLNGLLNEMRI